MHQRQLLTFASHFGLLNPPIPQSVNFMSEEYPGYSFLSPTRPSSSRLTPTQLKHLRQHYLTVESFPTMTHPALVDIDPFVQIWLRCRMDKTTYHCEKYERKNSTRLNHLACIKQSVDRNAHYSHDMRPEVMEDQYFYVSVKFYCVHRFLGKANMLMYSGYRKIEIYHGLVEDKDDHVDGFQDIRTLQHLCAKVSRSGGKTFIIDKSEMMEK